MPYNVICLACTVVAIAFGSFHNLSSRRFEAVDSTKSTGPIGKIKAALSKLKSKIFGKKEEAVSEEKKENWKKVPLWTLLNNQNAIKLCAKLSKNIHPLSCTCKLLTRAKDGKHGRRGSSCKARENTPALPNGECHWLIKSARLLWLDRSLTWLQHDLTNRSYLSLWRRFSYRKVESLKSSLKKSPLVKQTGRKWHLARTHRIGLMFIQKPPCLCCVFVGVILRSLFVLFKKSSARLLTWRPAVKIGQEQHFRGVVLESAVCTRNKMSVRRGFVTCD